MGNSDTFCILILPAILICLVGCNEAKSPARAEVPQARIIHAVGYIVPHGELRRLAFQSSGVICQVNCHPGDRVRAGEMLARLDDQLERASMHAVKARLAEKRSQRALVLAGAHPEAIRSAEALVEEAGLEKSHWRNERARMENLRAERGVSAMAADEAVFQAEVSLIREKKASIALEHLRNQVRPEDRARVDAELETALAEVNEAEAILRQKSILAPIDGIVLEIFLREGEVVSTATPAPVFLFAPSGPLEVRVEVDERFATILRPDAVTWVRSPDGLVKSSGRIRAIKSVMGRKTVFTNQAPERMDLQVLEAWITLDLPLDLPIGTEMAVEIEIPAAAAN